MGCQFCYSSSYNRFRRDETRDQLAIRQILAGLETLRESELGIEYINWTGGEALLQYDRLPNIFRRAHELGFKNILSTNCMFSAISGLGDRHDRDVSNARFSAYLWELEPVLDWIAVSWDSADPGINNDVMRLRRNGKGGSPLHYEDVQAFLEIYRQNQYNFGLKINTLVTAKNFGPAVLDVGNFLQGLRCIWKLIQFNPRECPPEHRKEYEVSHKDFALMFAAATEWYHGRPGYEQLRIVQRVYSGSDEPHCVLVINTSGQVLLPKGEGHVPVASLFGTDKHCVPAADLRNSILANVLCEMQGTEVYHKHTTAEGRTPLQVFSERNRGMLVQSYPPNYHPNAEALQSNQTCCTGAVR